ncbi:hypothetical protein BDR05DRAFT_959841 [Suillus weaverae]|nr:hypothetical protein BDR05DRAFT_959841 [Suillus weaverae]
MNVGTETGGGHQGLHMSGREAQHSQDIGVQERRSCTALLHKGGGRHEASGRVHVRQYESR